MGGRRLITLLKKLNRYKIDTSRAIRMSGFNGASETSEGLGMLHTTFLGSTREEYESGLADSNRPSQALDANIPIQLCDADITILLSFDLMRQLGAVLDMGPGGATISIKGLNMLIAHEPRGPDFLPPGHRSWPVDPNYAMWRPPLPTTFALQEAEHDHKTPAPARLCITLGAEVTPALPVEHKNTNQGPAQAPSPVPSAPHSAPTSRRTRTKRQERKIKAQRQKPASQLPAPEAEVILYILSSTQTALRRDV